MNVGERIRIIRKEKGLSIMQIREKTGLSKSTISEIENDKSSPSLDTLSKIAQALDKQIYDLISDEEINIEEITSKDALDENRMWSYLVKIAKNDEKLRKILEPAINNNGKVSLKNIVIDIETSRGTQPYKYDFVNNTVSRYDADSVYEEPTQYGTQVISKYDTTDDFNDPDIRAIARASKNLSKDKKDLLKKLAESMIEEAENGNEDN
jgi:transcriptional regulator with XRE-family HTH domain